MKKYLPLYLSWLALGCYSFTGGQVPFRTVSVPTATSLTSEFRLSELTTRALITALERDGRMRITEARSSQGLYQMEVVGYQRQPYVYDRQEVVTQYKVTITVNALLRSSSGKVIWEEKELQGWAVYAPGSEEETLGMERAAANLADEIVRRSLETW